MFFEKEAYSFRTEVCLPDDSSLVAGLYDMQRVCADESNGVPQRRTHVCRCYTHQDSTKWIVREGQQHTRNSVQMEYTRTAATSSDNSSPQALLHAQHALHHKESKH